MGPALSSAHGFSLLEVLVAFSLMAMTLGVLFQVFSGGLRLAAQSEGYSIALRLAQNQLAEAETVEVLRPGETEGRFELETFRWRQWVEPYDWAEPSAMQAAPVEAYWVTVEVFWGDRRPRSVSLSTVFLVPRA